MQRRNLAAQRLADLQAQRTAWQQRIRMLQSTCLGDPIDKRRDVQMYSGWLLASDAELQQLQLLLHGRLPGPSVRLTPASPRAARPVKVVPQGYTAAGWLAECRRMQVRRS